MSELVPCVFWVFFYNVCAASRDNISFWETLDGICGRNFFYPVMDMLQRMRERCLGLLKSGGGTLELSNGFFCCLHGAAQEEEQHFW